MRLGERELYLGDNHGECRIWSLGPKYDGILFYRVRLCCEGTRSATSVPYGSNAVIIKSDGTRYMYMYTCNMYTLLHEMWAVRVGRREAACSLKILVLSACAVLA